MPEHHLNKVAEDMIGEGPEDCKDMLISHKKGGIKYNREQYVA